MGDYKNFADCEKKVAAKHPDWPKERVKKYCGDIYWKTHGEKEGEEKLRKELKQLKEKINDKR